jgi:two-component system, sensor histidine kinase SagS
MAPETELRRLLTLHGRLLDDPALGERLREFFDVHVADDLKAAVGAMRETHFDAVLAETADFLPLERAMATHQSAVVLDTLGEGVCVVDGQGQMIWANRRLRQLDPLLRQRIAEVLREGYESLAASRFPEVGQTRRFSVMPEDGSYFEIICSPIYDPEGTLRQVAGVVVDATRQRRQQQTLNAIERAGYELVRLNADAPGEADLERRLRLLEERIIDCSRQVLNFQNFAVLLVDESTNRLRWLCSEGLDPSARRREYFLSTEGSGICGYVAATGHSYICGDVRDDPHYLNGLLAARSSLTVPLRLHDRVIGVFNAESTDPHAFEEDDRQFAEVFAHYLALALHVLDLLVTSHHSARSDLGGSLQSRLASPMSDIIVQASELIEDYIGHDELRHRLQAIIDQAHHARQEVRDLLDRPQPTFLDSLDRPETPEPADPTRLDLTGRRLLIVDDEDMIRKVLRQALKTTGCSVDLAADGAEALEKLQKQSYDMVITDLRMPGRTGYDVLADIRQRQPDTPVILITGFGLDPDHQLLQNPGRHRLRVLYKPFRVEALLATIRQILQA